MGVALDVGGSPADVAVLFVERGDGAFFTAGSANDRVLVNERRLGVAPGGDFSAEVFFQRFVPDHFARLRVDAGDVALGGFRIHELPLDGGRAAGTIAPVVDKLVAKLRRPQFAMVVDVDRDQELGVVAGAEDVEAVLDDGGAG